MNKYLIIGASSAVGIEYITHLIDRNEEMTVIAQYRTMSDDLNGLLVQAECSNVQLIPFRADLLNDSDVDALLDFISEKIECPTHIIHLPASKLHYRKLKDADWKFVSDDFKIQVVSLGRILSRFTPKMAKQRYGRILVLLSAVTCRNVPKYMSEYVLVKNAALGLVFSVSKEYADKNVYISGISPEMMETKLLSEVDEKIIALNAQNRKDGCNYSVHELLPYIDDIMSEETNRFNGINIYPEN